MKALEWHKFLESQQELHGKVLFRVAELANVAGRDPHALNVELGRLVRQEVITRYATGVYGLGEDWGARIRVAADLLLCESFPVAA